MKKTLFLTAMLAAVFAVPTMAATNVTLTDESETTSYTFTGTDNHLWFNFSGDADQTISTASSVALGTTDADGALWIGPKPRLDSYATINMSGALSGRGTIDVNAYSDDDYKTLVSMSGDASDFKGTLKLSDGNGTGTVQLNITGDKASTYGGAVIDAKNNDARFILNISGDTTLGGLKGGRVTSTSANHTLTLNVATTDVSTAATIGAVDGNGYYTAAEATSATASTSLNLVKTGGAKQTFTGAINIGQLTVKSGAVTMSNTGAVVSAANVEAGGSLELTSATFNGLTGGANAGTVTINGTASNDVLKLDKLSGSGTLVLKKIYGTLAAADGEITNTLQLVTADSKAAVEIKNFGGTSYTFDGAITGSSNMALDIGANKTVSFTFNGSLAGWNSGSASHEGFRVMSGTANVTIGGELTGTDAGVANSFSNNGGNINLTVNRNAAFLNKVDVRDLMVEAGTSVTASHNIFKANNAVQVKGALTITNSTDTNVGNYVSMGDNASLTLCNGAALKVSDSYSSQGVWFNVGSSLTIQDTSSINIANGALTITKAEGATEAVVTRLGNGAAKLGVNGNISHLTNVKVENAAIVYAGSGTIAFGTLVNSTLTMTNAASNATFGSLTMSGNTIELHEDHSGILSITSSLTVTEDSFVNANLVMNSGTMTFADNASLTMGCSVTIGNDTGDTPGTVTVVLTDEMVQTIKDGGRVNLFTDVESATLGSHIVFTGTNGALEQADIYELKYDEVSKTIYATPEPATATLSLLALAALAARRKRH